MNDVSHFDGVVNEIRKLTALNSFYRDLLFGVIDTRTDRIGTP